MQVSHREQPIQYAALSLAQSSFPRGVVLTRHGGPLSQLLDGLGASTLVRLDVIKDGQIVLNLPTPSTALHDA